ASRTDATGTTVIGARLHRARIHSSSLGRHDRDTQALWAYRRQQLSDDWRAEMGLDRVHYGHGTDQWLPSLALDWHFATHWHGFASWARSAREPTYTELYIDTPANQGNRSL